MLALLPLLAFALLTIAFRRRHSGWRASVVFASIPWALFLVCITETLTQFRLLTRTSVALCWLVFAAIAFLWVQRARPSPQAAPYPLPEKIPLHWSERTTLLLIAILAALIAVTALISAPNNWDAMEYHLPRVVEWISHRGVQFYPTVDWFQLDLPPFAEYVMLHLDLLYGSDRLVALVQWFAYLGSILGASLITQELGGNRRVQLYTAVLAASIPSAVLGASSTKNDCVLAYWIVLAVYFLLRWRRDQSWPIAFAIGSVLGLAMFTKGTAYMLLPCLGIGCVMTWEGPQRRRFLSRLPVIAAMILLVCAPLWVRNYRYTGSPLGIPYFRGTGTIDQRVFRNNHFTPPQIVADVARNLALNAGTPSDRINSLSTRAFSRFMQAIGVDPNQPGQMSYRQSGEALPFKVTFDPRDEFFSEDSIHLLLFLLATALCIVGWRRPEGRLRWFAFALIGAFILYCALLRWAPTNERYLIPLIMLGSAFTAVVLTPRLPRFVTNAIIGLVLLIALSLALVNETRPLLTRHGFQGSILTTRRDETYFFDRHRDLSSSFIAAARAINTSSCRSIGIDANLLHFEYPLMAMLTADGVPRQIRYVDVENSSTQYADPALPPVCIVACLHCLNHSEKFSLYSPKLPKKQTFGTLVLFYR